MDSAMEMRKRQFVNTEDAIQIQDFQVLKCLVEHIRIFVISDWVGYLKDKVYATPVPTRDDLVQRIQEACNEMRQNPNQVSDAVNSLIRRCHKCIEVGGQHFEQLRISTNYNWKPKGKAFYIGLAFVELGSQKKEIGNTSVQNIIRVPGVTVLVALGTLFNKKP
ncbi:hypothetical protein NQ315_014358 [Exocentrus adspersus]|uniref:Uncharacterized protein n=1 Tax=Exocentrus adspersus TaxID=1586481 RepID=A0AAV8VA16_9CUCU|nr:hypothetical protein NQ315_014358 [Exocentrus adspersus]